MCQASLIRSKALHAYPKNLLSTFTTYVNGLSEKAVVLLTVVKEKDVHISLLQSRSTNLD